MIRVVYLVFINDIFCAFACVNVVYIVNNSVFVIRLFNTFQSFYDAFDFFFELTVFVDDFNFFVDAYE